MKGACIRFLIILAIAMPSVVHSAEEAPCALQSSTMGICHQIFLFSKPLKREEQASVKQAVNNINEIVLTKDLNQLIGHERGFVNMPDQFDVNGDKFAFLFGEGPSKAIPRNSVRQIILEAKKPTVYVEPHDTWGIYKGDLYVVIFFDASKISLKEISKDLGKERRQYMSNYAATLIQLDKGSWSFPETAFFWETDGP